MAFLADLAAGFRPSPAAAAHRGFGSILQGHWPVQPLRTSCRVTEAAATEVGNVQVCGPGLTRTYMHCSLWSNATTALRIAGKDCHCLLHPWRSAQEILIRWDFSCISVIVEGVRGIDLDGWHPLGILTLLCYLFCEFESASGARGARLPCGLEAWDTQNRYEHRYRYNVLVTFRVFPLYQVPSSTSQ